MKINYLEKLEELAKQVTKGNYLGFFGWCGVWESYEFSVWDSTLETFVIAIRGSKKLTSEQAYIKALEECKKEGVC